MSAAGPAGCAIDRGERLLRGFFEQRLQLVHLIDTGAVKVIRLVERRAGLRAGFLCRVAKILRDPAIYGFEIGARDIIDQCRFAQHPADVGAELAELAEEAPDGATSRTGAGSASPQYAKSRGTGRASPSALRGSIAGGGAAAISGSRSSNAASIAAIASRWRSAKLTRCSATRIAGPVPLTARMPLLMTV
jgi:hypothetical protein